MRDGNVARNVLDATISYIQSYLSVRHIMRASFDSYHVLCWCGFGGSRNELNSGVCVLNPSTIGSFHWLVKPQISTIIDLILRGEAEMFPAQRVGSW